eukprot:363803-Chlamydomonas_euryale.AAC.1
MEDHARGRAGSCPGARRLMPERPFTPGGTVAHARWRGGACPVAPVCGGLSCCAVRRRRRRISWRTSAASAASSDAAARQKRDVSPTAANFANTLDSRPSRLAVSPATTAPPTRSTGSGTMHARGRRSSVNSQGSPTRVQPTGRTRAMRSSRATSGEKHSGHGAEHRSWRPPKLTRCCMMATNEKTWPHGVMCGHAGGASRLIAQRTGAADAISTSRTSSQSIIRSASAVKRRASTASDTRKR